MVFPSDWDEVMIISHMQRKVLLCSIAYYEYDYSPVSDYTYDKWAHELAALMANCPDVDKTRYYYAFRDFDGSTGYFLYSRLNEQDKFQLTRMADPNFCKH